VCVQSGELTQIVSGGLLKAMPHAVKMPSADKEVARASFALFLEPNFDVRICAPAGTDMGEVFTVEDAWHKLPPLDRRWTQGMAFGQYFKNCLSMFN